MKTIATLITAGLMAALLPAGPAQAELLTPTRLTKFCGPLDNAYGPYDYRKGKSEFEVELKMVERAHFNEDVKFGIRGITGFLSQDLDYTLRSFPNHAEALATMMRVALRDKQLELPFSRRPVECYFDRAVRFAMDDPTVHALYGSYLFGRGKDDDRQRALDMFLTSLALKPDNPAVSYNVGLAYFHNGKLKEANGYAQQAYAGGFPLPGLKNMLVKAGAWDPSAPAPDPSKAGSQAVAAAKAAAARVAEAEAAKAAASGAPEAAKAAAGSDAAAAPASVPPAAAATAQPVPAAPAAQR